MSKIICRFNIYIIFILFLFLRFDVVYAEEVRIPKVTISCNDIIQDDSYVGAEIKIYDENGTEVISDDSSSIKIRGNYTATLDKKPYNIKFSKKNSVLGMSKGKKWCLLANRTDATYLRNKIVFDFSKQLRFEYVPDNRFVDLWLNDTYIGNYLMTMPIEVGSNRLDIDVDNGDFLIETSRNREEEGIVYIVSNSGLRFEINEPERISDAEIVAITQKINQIEEIIDTKNYQKIHAVIDIDSFIDFYILHELFKTQDVNNSSTRFYMKDNKLYAGPVWDWDISCGNNTVSRYNNPENICAISSGWIKKLMECEEFAHQFCFRLKELQPLITALYDTKIDEYVALYESAFARDYTEAGWELGYCSFDHCPIGASYVDHVNVVKNFLRRSNLYLYTYFDCENQLDYSQYYSAMLEVNKFSPQIYDFTDIQEYLDYDVYQENITQSELDSVTSNILDAIENLQYKSFLIHFECNGGSELDDIEVEFNSDIPSLGNTERDNYLFDGWFMDAEFTEAFEFEKMPAKDITLYAKWEFHNHVITVSDNKVGATCVNSGFSGDEYCEGVRTKSWTLYSLKLRL